MPLSWLCFTAITVRTVLATNIYDRAQLDGAWLRSIRRALHRQPELGMEVFQTSALVRGWLDDLGVPYLCGLAMRCNQWPCALAVQHHQRPIVFLSPHSTSRVCR